MYERFTDRARKIMKLANQEAQRFNHEYIGTEHILLGLVGEGSGVGVNVLKNLDVDLRKIHFEVEKLVQRGPNKVSMGRLPQTPRAKKVIEHAMKAARDLGHNYVGTEHVLLGLFCERETVAAQILMNLGLRLENVRAEVLALLGAASKREGVDACDLLPPIRWSEEDTKRYLYQSDDEAKNRACQLAEEIAPLQRAKEDAVANQDFLQAAQLRDQEYQKRGELAAISLPAWLRRNIEQAAGLTWASIVPLLHTLVSLRDRAEEPDARALSLLPNPLVPPVKFVVGVIPRFPASTLKAVLPPDDIGSPFFQVRIPSISPESVGRFKCGHKELVQRAFIEIEKTEDAKRGCPVLLCVVHPTALAEDVREQLFAGILRTNCQFVVFEQPSEAQVVLGQLPPETKLLGAQEQTGKS